MMGALQWLEKIMLSKLKCKIYPRAASVHCAPHQLNQVVIDLNVVAEVCNATGIIRDTVLSYSSAKAKKK